MKGRLEASDARSVGVVGSRRTTHYGREQARRFSSRLARSGVSIISGLALGIDTVAHEAALEAGGRTIAVLGSGIGHLYPPQNRKLAEAIIESGALLSEFPVLYVPDKQSFPLRNRIVAGLSQALLVVEAPARSGSLITADQALEQGRTVYAIPGPVDRPNSEGCHRLIQQGAALVTSPDDVLAGLGVDWNPLQLEFLEEAGKSELLVGVGTLTASQQTILNALSDREHTIDSLTEGTGMPVAEVSTALLHLEIEGFVKQLPGKYFVKLI